MAATITKIVRYKAKKKKLPKLRTALAEFVENIKENEPGTTLYEVFQEKNDPTVFVHLMIFKDKQAEKTHAKNNYVQKWIKILHSICKEDPEFSDLKLVKSIKGSENESAQTDDNTQEAQQ